MCASCETIAKMYGSTTDELRVAPEPIEHCSQLSEVGIMTHKCEPVQFSEKCLKNPNMRDTEVSALNMEIETLRWQLSQTETNRQMHIALLKQVVAFLSRVKEHIELQTPEPEPNKPNITGSRDVLTRDANALELPRSRSVLHVSKSEYITSGKKLGTRKISKSISNVNTFKDYVGIWNQSKLSLTSNIECSQKITEEMTRLITLANSVLNTKLPDLACKCNDSINDTLKSDTICDSATTDTNDSISSLNFTDEDTTNAFILNTIYDSEDAFDGLNNAFVDAKNEKFTNFVVTSPLTCGLENDFAHNVNEKDLNIKTQMSPKMGTADKRSEYNHTNFIEDESGFSSMSSFQEIGIPIISIIPPSPCKELSYLDEITDILDETENWKKDALDLDKQTVKVFWV